MKYQYVETAEMKEGILNPTDMIKRGIDTVNGLLKDGCKITKVSVDICYETTAESDKRLIQAIENEKENEKREELHEIFINFKGALDTLAEGLKVRDQCINFIDALNQWVYSEYGDDFVSYMREKERRIGFIEDEEDGIINVSLLDELFEVMDLPFKYVSGSTIHDLVIVNTRAEKTKNNLIYCLYNGSKIIPSSLRKSEIHDLIHEINESYIRWYEEMYHWDGNNRRSDYDIERYARNIDTTNCNIILWRNNIPYRLEYKSESEFNECLVKRVEDNNSK